MGFYHLKYASPYDGQYNVYLPAGTLIGYIGSSGVTSGSHLHYFVTKDGTYQSGGNEAAHVVDPVRFFPNVSFTWQ